MQQTNISAIAILVGVIVVWGLFSYFVGNFNAPAAYQAPYQTSQHQPAASQQPANSQAAITNDSELMSASQELDTTDTSQIDSGLNQNDNDSSSF